MHTLQSCISIVKSDRWWWPWLIENKRTMIQWLAHYMDNNVVEVEAAPHPQWLKLRLIGSAAYNYAEKLLCLGTARKDQSCMEWGDRAWGTKQPASSSSKGNTKAGTYRHNYYFCYVENLHALLFNWPPMQTLGPRIPSYSMCIAWVAVSGCKPQLQYLTHISSPIYIIQKFSEILRQTLFSGRKSFATSDCHKPKLATTQFPQFILEQDVSLDVSVGNSSMIRSMHWRDDEDIVTGRTFHSFMHEYVIKQYLPYNM